MAGKLWARNVCKSYADPHMYAVYMHIEPANYMCVPVKHKKLDNVKIGPREGGLKVHILYYMSIF